MQNPRYIRWKRSLRKASRTRKGQILRILRQYTERGWSDEDRGMLDYEEILSLRPGTIASHITKKLRKSKTIRILDVGSLDNCFLSELKDRFKGRVSLEGLSLARRPFLPRGIGMRIGLIEKFRREKEYDFIFSAYGAGYATNIGLALENIYNSLKVGGEAFIDLKPTNIKSPNVLRKLLVEAIPARDFTIKGTEDVAVIYVRRSREEPVEFNRLLATRFRNDYHTRAHAINGLRKQGG